MSGMQRRLGAILGTITITLSCAGLLAGCAEDISGSDGKRQENIKLVLQSVDPASVYRPAWIDDDTIIFSWTQDTPKEQLWTVKVSGGNPVRFIEDNQSVYIHPTYSSNLAVVAYEVSEDEFTGSNIDVKTLDRTRGTRYAAGDEASSVSYPCWGPDGNSIGYLRTSEEGLFFVMVELDKSYALPRPTANTGQFSLERGFQLSRMAWYAPAGGEPFTGKVAFNRIPPNAQGGTEIYYYDLDLERQIRLTDDKTVDASSNINPSWSPDGKHIVYSSDHRNGSSPEFRRDLYVVSVSTKATVRLTRTGDNEEDPAWSPDGTRIAYVSDGDLYVLTIDTKFLPD